MPSYTTAVLVGLYLLLVVVQAQNGDGELKWQIWCNSVSSKIYIKYQIAGSGGIFDPCYTDADCFRDLHCLGGTCQ